jgi:hypothetical protein
MRKDEFPIVERYAQQRIIDRHNPGDPVQHYPDNVPRTHMDILLDELASGEDLDYPCEKCPAAEYCDKQSTTDENNLCGPIFARWARMEVET